MIGVQSNAYSWMRIRNGEIGLCRGSGRRDSSDEKRCEHGMWESCRCPCSSIFGGAGMLVMERKQPSHNWRRNQQTIRVGIAGWNHAKATIILVKRLKLDGGERYGRFRGNDFVGGMWKLPKLLKEFPLFIGYRTITGPSSTY